MPIERLKQILPTQRDVLRYRCLHFLEKHLCEPSLWHCNRNAIASACFVGLFVAMLPIPMQMLLAAFLAIAMKANLPLAVSLVWISNPLTLPPLMYVAFQLGSWIMHIDVIVEPASTTLVTQLLAIGPPLFIGSLMMASIAGLTGYYAIHWLWRRRTISRWQQRQRVRTAALPLSPSTRSL